MATEYQQVAATGPSLTTGGAIWTCLLHITGVGRWEAAILVTFPPLAITQQLTEKLAITDSLSREIAEEQIGKDI